MAHPLSQQTSFIYLQGYNSIFACPSVSSSRYDAPGGIEVISPANSPALREEKNEGPFPSEKSSQPPTGETSKPCCLHKKLETERVLIKMG